MKNGDYLNVPMTCTDWGEVLDALDMSESRIVRELKAVIRKRLREPRDPATNTRYRLMSDDSGHQYVVPVSYENHFRQILLDDKDPGEYYTRVEGGLTFTDPLGL